MKQVVKQAKNVNEAIKLALSELGTTIENVDVKIIDEGASGFMGLFGKKDAVVRVCPKFDSVSSLEELVYSYLKSMNIDSTIKVTKKADSHMLVDIQDDKLGFLIGRHGNTLEAFEHLINLAINRKSPYHLYVTINVDNYLQIRQQTLTKLAQNVANKVKETKRKFIFEPMKPNERKIVHIALQNMNNIKTTSIGKDPERKIIVEYVG